MPEDNFTEDLPEITRDELVAVASSTSVAQGGSVFLSTKQGIEALRRLYMEDRPAKDLAFIFNTNAEAIQYITKREGWYAQLQESRERGALALQKEKLRAKADDMKMRMLGVLNKALTTAEEEEYTGEMVIENAVKMRAITQSISDISPSDEAPNPQQHALINIGLQIN